MPRIRSPQDAAAGLFLIIWAAGAWYFAQDLQVGLALRMGPGYIPNLLAWIIFFFGLVVLAGAFVVEGPRLQAWTPKPLVIILGAILLFGFTIERFGLVVASVLVVLFSSIAAPDYNWKQSIIVAAALAVFSVFLFPIALGLSMRIWPW